MTLSVYKNELTRLSIASAPALLRLFLHALAVPCQGCWRLSLVVTVSGCWRLSLVVTVSGRLRLSPVVTVSGCYCLWLLLSLACLLYTSDAADER